MTEVSAKSPRVPLGIRLALAAAFVLLGLSFVIVRFPPWPHLVFAYDVLVMKEHRVTWFTRVVEFVLGNMVIYWWAFTALCGLLALLAFFGRIGRRGWGSVAAVTFLSLLWVGYAWHSFPRALSEVP